MRVKEIPVEHITVEGLTELLQGGLKGIVDGDKRILRNTLRNISEELLAALKTKPKAFGAFFNSLT